MIRIIWAASAHADLARLDRFYRDIEPAFAQSVVVQATLATRLLRDHPRAGTPVPHTRQRKWRVADTPYILICRETGDEIRVLRVVHSAQDWAQKP